MKLRILTAALQMAALTAVATAAQAGPYVGVNGGVAFFHDSDFNDGIETTTLTYDLGFAVGASVGFQWENGVRLEAEFGYRKADTDTIDLVGMGAVPVEGDLRVMSYMLNGFYDFPIKSVVRPFLGAGIGLLDGRLSDTEEHASDTVFGYQAMAGVALKAAPHITLDLSYRYQGAANDFSLKGTELSYGSSNVMFGVRYDF